MSLPAPAQARLADRLPIVDLAREVLEPGFRLLMGAQSMRPNFEEQGVDGARSAHTQMFRMLAPEPHPLAREADLLIPVEGGTIRARLYDAGARDSLAPGIVYFHGGGHTLGTLEDYDPVCATLATATGAIVVSVEYRLAPEHRAPIAASDSFAGHAFVRKHAAALGIDSTRLAVMGDSAGGNLSAAVAQQCLDDDVPSPILQVLVYPGLDMTQTYDSALRFGEGFGLESTTTGWFRDHYIGEGEAGRRNAQDPARISDAPRGPPGTAPRDRRRMQ